MVTVHLLLRGSPARCSRRSRGITLLEVLISMFVLVVGLLSIAALIPAGRHEVGQAARLENAAMVGRAAFRDLQVRGYLNPATWRQVDGTAAYDPRQAAPYVLAPEVSGLPVTRSSQLRYALDPLGIAAIRRGGSSGQVMPYDADALIFAALTRIAPVDMSAAGAEAYMDTVFRASSDLITVPNATNADLPPQQKWLDDSGSPANQLRRASLGDYSWLATLVSSPINEIAIVSVAVFYKRDLNAPGAGESHYRVTNVSTAYVGAGGGELRVDGSANRIKPGQWVMLSHRDSQDRKFLRWYRVVAATRQGINQHVTISGTNWDGASISGSETRVFVFDNLVAVYEKTLPLEFTQ